jgi:hypothetical protein
MGDGTFVEMARSETRADLVPGLKAAATRANVPQLGDHGMMRRRFLAGGSLAAGVLYTLAGSFVSSLRGVPRASHDIEIMVDLSRASVGTLLADPSDPDDPYVDSEAVEDAVRRRTTFNAIDFFTADMVDCGSYTTARGAALGANSACPSMSLGWSSPSLLPKT